MESRRSFLVAIMAAAVACGSEQARSDLDLKDDPSGTPPRGTELDETPLDVTETTTPETPKDHVVVAGLTFPGALAADESGAYWIEDADGAGLVRHVSPGGAPVTIASGITKATAIAVDATRVYWTRRDALVEAVAKSGGAVTIVAKVTSSGLALGDSNLFFATTDGSVVSVPKAGGPAELLASINGGGTDVAVDDQNVFFTTMPKPDAGPPATGVLWKRSRFGAGVAKPIATGLSTPSHVVLDANAAFVSVFGAGEIVRVPKNGGAPSIVATGEANPFGIAVDATKVYWTTFSGGELVRAPKQGGSRDVMTSGLVTPHGVAIGAGAVWVTVRGAKPGKGALLAFTP
jgi:hypothetical protein